MEEKTGIDAEELIRCAKRGRLEPEDIIENLQSAVRKLVKDNDGLEERCRTLEKDLRAADDEIDELKTAIAAAYIDKWVYGGGNEKK